MKLWLKILVCVVVINVLGGAGAFVTMGEMKGWYAELNKPPGVPPSWVFGPVWTVLYAMIGLSLALFWHRVEADKNKRIALIWFVIQMVLNLAWTPLFFGAHWPGIALLVILTLWGCIFVTLILFRRRDRFAGRLLIPYLIWVSYASYLNAGYWWLN